MKLVDNPNEIFIDGSIAYRYIYNPYYYINKDGVLYSTYIKGGNGKYSINNIRKVAYGQDNDGYYRVVLSLHGVHTYIKVHQIMVNQFLGGCPDDMVINHKDGNKHNNSVSNLEVITSLENTHHAWETGLNRKELNPNRIEMVINDNLTNKSYHFLSLQELKDSELPISTRYIHHIKNNEINFNICYFKKVITGTGRFDYVVECYYNGHLYKTYKDVKEAGEDFGKPSNSVSSAFRGHYPQKMNRYTITFPNVSTTENNTKQNVIN